MIRCKYNLKKFKSEYSGKGKKKFLPRRREKNVMGYQISKMKGRNTQ